MTNITVPQLSYKAYGHDVTVEPHFGRYGQHRLAISFHSNGEHFGVLTVNLPEVDLTRNEVIIKDWSENEALAAAAFAAGWIVLVAEVPSGFVTAKICKLDGDLLAFAKATGQVR